MKRLRKHKDSKQLTQKSKSKDAGSPLKPTRTNKDTSSETTRKLGETVCPSDECGKTISIPLKVIGQSEEQSYYACPYCLSKLDSTNAKQKDFAEQSPFKNLAPPKKADPEETEDTAKCSHYFGYLREHPKYIPIPDECLTCPKKADPEETEDTGKCNHYFGYLRERPKYVPISDECLTCSKATKCLLG